MAWILMFAGAAVGSLLGCIYLTTRIRKFAPFHKLAESHKLLGWVLPAAPLVIGCIALYLFNTFTMFVVLLHLLFIWMGCELVMYLIRKFTKKECKFYIAGFAALLLWGVVLFIGWQNAHNIRITNYSFTTEKSLGGEPLRIVMFADSHLGITLDKDNFPKEVERIQAQNPDIVIIAGDYVDDDTKKEDMLAATEALGTLKTKYGVYFTYGNHDNGYFHYRNFEPQDLRDALTKNGVKILEDETVLIDGRFYLCGRNDRTFKERRSAQEITASLDKSKYIIMVDHQPNDYENEAAAGADLILSGHTHGGHIFPAGLIGLLLGANDRIYGTETRGSSTFVVTSGISGWAIPLKTGTFSEFCVIDIAQ